jgi:hypothetical protein
MRSQKPQDLNAEMGLPPCHSSVQGRLLVILVTRHLPLVTVFFIV